jgi:hypothetical protein
MNPFACGVKALARPLSGSVARRPIVGPAMRHAPPASNGISSLVPDAGNWRFGQEDQSNRREDPNANRSLPDDIGAQPDFNSENCCAEQKAGTAAQQRRTVYAARSSSPVI